MHLFHCLILSRTLVLHLIATWPWKPRSPIWCAQLILNPIAWVPSLPSVHRRHKDSCFCLCSFVSWLLQLNPTWLSSVFFKHATESSVRRCFRVPKTVHISPCHASLHRLPAKCVDTVTRIQYKLASLCHKCVFWIFFSERWQSTVFQIFSLP